MYMSDVVVTRYPERKPLNDSSAKTESFVSGVSWAAILAGAFASASLALILFALGSGLGFSSVSPWSHSGASAGALGKGAIAWLIVTQIMASALGGYLAGRLRTKWANVHTDEVYFRDTAHGFLVWAVGMVLTAAFLTSAATSLAGGALQASPNTTNAGDSTGTNPLNPSSYYVDMIMRSNSVPATGRNDVYDRSVVERIFAHALSQGSMPQGDHAYLTQMVTARSGLNETEADKRVTDAFSSAQQTSDTTRKTMAHLSLWLFVALLSGAFCAAYAGTIGGRQRDRVDA